MRTILGIFSLFWKLYIAVVFGITAVLFYPFITLQLFSENGKKRAFKVFVMWSWAFRILCFYHIRRIQKNEQPNRPHVIIANHSSYLDIFLMYSIFPKQPFLFLGKSEILNYPLLKTYFKRMNIPVYRDNPVKSARALVKASREARNGWSLVIFPEGGIPDEDCPKMVDFKEGAFQLAKNLKLPILPITYVNNFKLFSDPTFILGPARPGISKVYVHEAISEDVVENMSKEELKQYCFDTINGPLLELYPHLK